MEPSELNPGRDLVKALRRGAEHMLGQVATVASDVHHRTDKVVFGDEPWHLGARGVKVSSDPLVFRWEFDIKRGRGLWRGRGHTMWAAWVKAELQLTKSLQVAAAQCPAAPAESKPPLWPRWTKALQYWVQVRIDETWLSKRKKAPAGTDVWVRRFMQEGREWTFRVSHVSEGMFPETRYLVGIGLSDDAAVGGNGDAPISAGMDAVAALKKACEAYHAKAMRKLPPYTEKLGAFLKEKLAAEWAYMSEKRRESNGSCHADSRIWFLKVSRLADGLYRTSIEMYGHGKGASGQGACPGDADAFAIGALREECAKENPPMANIIKRENPHMGTVAEQRAAKETQSRPLCRDLALVREMGRLSRRLYRCWEHDGESENWPQHSTRSPVSPWGIRVARADCGWVVDLTHQRTSNQVSAIRYDFHLAVRAALVALADSYPEYIRPSTLAPAEHAAEQRAAPMDNRVVLPINELQLAAAALALEAEVGFDKTVSLPAPYKAWSIAVESGIEDRSVAGSWSVAIRFHDADKGKSCFVGYAGDFAAAYTRALEAWKRKRGMTHVIVPPLQTYIDGRRKSLGADQRTGGATAPAVEPVPIVAPIAPYAARVFGERAARAFREFPQVPEDQVTIQSRPVPGSSWAVQLTVLPNGEVGAEVSWYGSTRTQWVTRDKIASFEERITTAVSLVIETAMSDASDGYATPEIEGNLGDDEWRKVPTPHEPPSEEGWPASQHGGMKWLN